MSNTEPEPCELAYAAGLLDASAAWPAKHRPGLHGIALIGALLRERAGVHVEGAIAHVRANRADFHAAADLLDTCARTSIAGAPMLAKVANWLRAWCPC